MRPLVFLHGLGCAPRQWRFQREHFSRRPALAPLLPGHGGTAPPPYVAEAIAAAVWSAVHAWTDEPVVLVGHSIGGNLAAVMAGVEPRAVAGLVLADPTGDLRKAEPAELAEIDGRLRPENYPRRVREWFADEMKTTAPGLRSEILEDLASLPREVFAGYWGAFRRADALGPLQARQGRALCIESAGSREPYLFQRLLPGLRCQTLPAGHWLHLDRPAEFNAALERFLADTNLG
ncbi:MAG: alpha/beta hydrolase [Elusimicrobia bacterium]|nr:alpha/beta hydrolase [Elusimicrobiota bacterium]